MTLTLRQIAEFVGISKQAIEKRAKKESWPSCGTTIINHNETKLYAVADLPADIREKIEDRPSPLSSSTGGEEVNGDMVALVHTTPLASSPSSLAPGLINSGHARPAPVASTARGNSLESNQTTPHLTSPHDGRGIKDIEILRPDSVTELKQWQRDVMTARLAVLGAVESVAASEGLTINRAIERFLELLAGGMIDDAISAMAETANHRKGSERLLTKGTVYRWIRDKKQLGNLGLAPADKEQMTVPPWAREFLALWRQPQKRSIPDILEDMGNRAPSYGQACRFLKKFSRVDAQRGRMTGSDLRSIRGYVRRDKSKLEPLDLCVADGHSFKARVAHPSGGYHHPEMETVIDVATRACIGWSVGLSESAHVVADALRHAVTVNEQKPMGGAMAIFYTDRGAGNKAGEISDVELGVLARIGATHEMGRAGNPQGRGVIEELQGSLWVRAAKKLPTYTGRDMDKGTERKLYLLILKDIKKQGKSDLLMPWGRFLRFAQDEVDAYNNRPHSSLPKISDPNTGLRRHMTPTEMWRAFVFHGWQPIILSPEEIKDLFRPQITVRCRRAQVNVFGNIYYHKLLEHYHGEELIVSYDIHDAKTVQVRDRDQRLICEAIFDANKRDFFPVPVIEQARQKRMERRLKLVEDKAWEIKQEGRGVIGAALPQEDPIIAATMPDEPAPERELDMTEYEEVM